MKKRHPFQLFLIGLIPTGGFAVFYAFPLFLTFIYAFQSEGSISLASFVSVWQNVNFQNGLKNLLLIGLLCVSSSFLPAVPIGLLLSGHKRMVRYAMPFLVLPLLVPSSAAVQLWQQLFHIDILTPWYIQLTALASLFVWKNTGTAAAILYVALIRLPDDVLEAARLDGCSGMILLLRIKLPLIRGEISLTLLFLLMYYFRIYKESYLLFGQYPVREMYLVQHYMANTYMKMNVQSVSAAAAILAMICFTFFALVSIVSQRRK